MRKIFYNSENSRDEVKSLSQFSNNSVNSGEISIIIQEVKEKGDPALLDYTRLYDNIDLSDGVIQVAETDLKKARASLSKKVYDALSLSAKRIKKFHKFALNQKWNFENSNFKISFFFHKIFHFSSYQRMNDQF